MALAHQRRNLGAQHLLRASFSSTTRLHDAASDAWKKSGTLPSYGPVGVAKALEASPGTGMCTHNCAEGRYVYLLTIHS